MEEMIHVGLWSVLSEMFLMNFHGDLLDSRKVMQGAVASAEYLFESQHSMRKQRILKSSSLKQQISGRTRYCAARNRSEGTETICGAMTGISRLRNRKDVSRVGDTAMINGSYTRL